MPETERLKWNRRYGEKGPGLAAPAGFLMEIAELLPRAGRALDVAGGAGRNAIWLAKRGLEVTVVDISEVGLELARQHGVAQGVELATRCVDLESDPLPPGPWDVVLIFHYLQRDLLGRLKQILTPNGLLVFVHPTRTNREKHEHPSERFLLDEGEAALLLAEFEHVVHREHWTKEGRHEVELVARKPRRST